MKGSKNAASQAVAKGSIPDSVVDTLCNVNVVWKWWMSAAVHFLELSKNSLGKEQWYVELIQGIPHSVPNIIISWLNCYNITNSFSLVVLGTHIDWDLQAHLPLLCSFEYVWNVNTTECNCNCTQVI